MLNPEKLVRLATGITLASAITSCAEPQKIPEGFSREVCQNMGLKLLKPTHWYMQEISTPYTRYCFVTEQPISEPDDYFSTGFKIEVAYNLQPTKKSTNEFLKQPPAHSLTEKQTTTQLNMIISQKSLLIYAHQEGERAVPATFRSVITAVNEKTDKVYLGRYDTPKDNLPDNNPGSSQAKSLENNKKIADIMTDPKNLIFDSNY